MFEAAELGRAVPKPEFERRALLLREALLDAQQRLRGAHFPVIVVFAGVDGAGKGETVNLLHEWMDPRWLETHAYGEPSDEERERPGYWRFWRDLPAQGRVGLFLSSWYSRPILDRVHRRISRATFDQHLDRMAAFERALTDGGAVVIKFWMHLDQAGQKRRLQKLERARLTRWRVTRDHWRNWKLYDRFVETAEVAIRRTSVAAAPWLIVEGADERYRTLAVGEALLTAITERLGAESLSRGGAAVRQPTPTSATAGAAAGGRTVRPRAAVGRGQVLQPTILSHLDMTQRVAKRHYDTELERLQGRLNGLERQARARGVSTILVFEGWDAAGKGGAIRRITAALDARDYQVIPVAAPSDEERAHHYLWRFWRHLARAGRVTVFDRSWYGRVLVERVEGFASEPEWRRAYAEINEFEGQLVDHGYALVKCWLHITREEQLRRFRAREHTTHKRWKITDEDWRNRTRWDQYELAVNDMVERTSTHLAPWTLVEGNDKPFARLKILETVCDRLERALA
jgi:polyphosphate:AMP phosphotransferase